MRQSIFCLMILTLFVCLGTVALHAQTSTEGSIAGTVTDPSGAVVSGAAVTIHNMGTNAEIKLTSDASGFFKAPLLEPGTYRVTFAAPGFSSYRADNVIVQVGQVTSLLPHLTVGASSSSVEVVEQASVVNLESPDFSNSLSSVALQSIPINNRRWSSLAMTTPGVVSDSSGFGLVAVRGISPILNNVEIDGADDNQAYYSEERGRTREAYSTTGAAVREFAVNTGVYSAEYGRAAGGVITSVTKSGTNQIHGQAYFWDRESKWNAYNDYAKLSVLNSAGTAYIATPIRPKDLRKIYGFTAGGALIKDKLFWIYTYDQHSRIFPGTSVPGSAASFYSLPTLSASFASGESCSLTTGYLTGTGDKTKVTPTLPYDSNYTLNSQACTLAARQIAAGSTTVTTYDQGVAAYDAGIAGLNSDMGSVPRIGYQEINTPKLDWQINSKEHLSVLYHRLNWDSPGGVQTQATNNYARDTFGMDYVHLNYGVAKLTSLLTSNIGNELLYQYGRELDDESQQPYTSYTKSYLTAGGNVPEVNVNASSGGSGIYIGSPYYSYRKALPDERKWQVGDVLYWNKGNHSFKFGVDAVHNDDLMNNTYESNGYISYNYFGNYFNDLLNEGKTTGGLTCDKSSSSAATSSASAVGTYSCYSSFVQGFGNPVFEIATMDTAFFGQDNWKFSPRLTLELGLRWDYEALPAPVDSLTTANATSGAYFYTYPGLTNNPSDKKNFGPRIGFSYDVSGNGKTVLRGGYGIYYGRITNGNLLNLRLNTGSTNGQFTSTYKNTTVVGPQFPNIESATGAAAKPNSYFLAPNLRNPQVQEFDLLVTQAIGAGTYVQASYLGALGRELPNWLDLNLNPATTGTGAMQNVTISVSDASGKGPLPNGATYVVPTYTSYGNTALFGTNAANFQAISELTSNINSNYNAMVFEVLNRSLKTIQFDASYTWSHALDFAQQAGTTTTTNNWYDPYSNARINYGDSSYNVPNRFVAYALYNFPNLHSSNWVRYLVNDWSLNDSFQTQNGLPYTVAVSSYTSPSIGSYWNGASGSTMIPFIGINTMKFPRRMVDDVRFQKQVSFGKGRSLDLMWNIFNVANHQNIDGLGTTAYKLSGTTATYQGQIGNASLNTYQVPTSSNNSGFLYTPRQLEIAARFNF
jgi:outer membrane receptor protein involved in Fe transport